MDPWGCWIYIQVLGGSSQKEKNLWSASHQPIPGDPDNMQVTFFPHMAVYRRTEGSIASTMEVTVAPEDPVEIRRLHLLNNSDQSKLLRITSYGEVVLGPQAGDNRHPAFNNLFIESEFLPELNLQVFTRRPRDNQEESIFMGHMLVCPGNQQPVQYEVDRYHFIGRHHSYKNPVALVSGEELRNSNDITLDPIFALGGTLDIGAHQTEDLAYLTFTANNREEIIALAEQYQNWSLLEQTFHQADLVSQAWMTRQEVTTPILQNILQVLTACLYPFKLIRTSPETIAENRLSQSALWRFGISGDYPILLVEIGDPFHAEVVSEVLQVHKYLRSRGFLMDVVILNSQHTDYGAELDGTLRRLVSRKNSDGWVNQRGGIYFLKQDQMQGEELTLLRTAARVLVMADAGALGDQLPGYSMVVHHLPQLPDMRQAQLTGETRPRYEEAPIDPMGDRLFSNGYGAFGADGREYVIDLIDGKTTPAPWVNVVGYPDFGFMVSESGSQCTWSVNSGENRLTPWSNDPVQDPTGEALYLRDEETGEFWTPTPLPAGSSEPYRIAHGAGYTTFEHNSHGLQQKMTIFASPEDPVKIIHLTIKNSLQHTRRVTATQFVEWVLGTTPAASMPYIIPEYDPTLECLLATNPYHNEFGERVAFLAASKSVHGLTADRVEFIGRNRSLANPAALHRLGLETRISAGEDPCAVLQVHLDLLPGAAEEIYFVLGEGSDKSHAMELIKKYKDAASVSAAFERTHVFWDRLLNTIQVHTPEPALDVMMNRWLLYQSLSCRIWGRSGFYQSSGAFGFRDQLQDVLALQAIDPAITRGQILNAARHQFEEGDVLHWWHPPSGRGVRTRISDDLLWLPYVTAMYIETTGDDQILDEELPFLSAPVLDEDTDERYGEYPKTNQSFSLLEHCSRAIEKGATSGTHELPLIGGGDWNDGFNRVGANGKGESVWMAWFLYDVLTRFAVIHEQRGDIEKAQSYRTRAKVYADAVEKSGWDGGWYRRGYYDSGTPLGSITNTECQIDALAQSWSVLSGAGDPQRSQQALQAVLDRLVRPKDRLILLFTPPFDKTRHNPGYIKGYQPGIRENGGQYTHAAAWTAWAFAALGEGEKAGELFDLLNPIYQTDTAEKASVYRVEPYVICADIYSTPPFVRRGGWTWYTGSASWIYRLGLEAILGFKKVGSNLVIDPVIPPYWDGFEIAYRFGDSTYRIHVHNPDHVSRQVKQVTLDDSILEDMSFPLVDDKREHLVLVTMGKAHPDSVE
jgi:cyclic beta-1,2-glucan synthetase